MISKKIRLLDVTWIGSIKYSWLNDFSFFYFRIKETGADTGNVNGIKHELPYSVLQCGLEKRWKCAENDPD